MFIRGPSQEGSIWHHFRRVGDGFVFRELGEVYESHVMANADRVVELFLALSEHLPPAVNVDIDEYRTGARWRGEDLALVDVRDAMARLKRAIATYAGVEFTVHGPDDQLSVTSNLDIFVYARSDRWLYLLQGKGLRRVQRLRARSWRLRRGEFAPAASLSAAVQDAAERLGLERAASRGET